MQGGEISGNTVQGGDWVYGGGVRVDKGTFTMEGGAISGNTAGRGGGVMVESNSTFTMQGGTIYGSAAVGTVAGANANKTNDDRNAALHVSASGSADGNFIGYPTAQYGKTGSLKPFGSGVANGGLTEGAANRTLSVDP
jgi:hypothetical protein